jgi:hypothetical protein
MFFGVLGRYSISFSLQHIVAEEDLIPYCLVFSWTEEKIIGNYQKLVPSKSPKSRELIRLSYRRNRVGRVVVSKIFARVNGYNGYPKRN